MTEDITRKIKEAKIKEINFFNRLHNEEISNEGLYFGLIFGIVGNLIVNIYYEELIKKLGETTRLVILFVVSILFPLIIYFMVRRLIKIKARQALSKMHLKNLEDWEEFEKIRNDPKKFNEILSRSFAEISKEEQDELLKRTNEQGAKFEKWYLDTMKKAGYKFKK